MTEPDFPRVLVISGYPFSRDNATGITLSNIFSQWPADQLALLYVTGALEPEFQPKRMEMGEWRWFPLNHLAKKRVSGEIRKLSAEIPGAEYHAKGEGRRPFLRFLHRLVRLSNEYIPVLDQRPIYDFIEKFKPEVIYSMLGPIKYIDFVAGMAKRYSVPVVPHFMDDWPSFLYSDGYLFGLPRRSLDKAMAGLLCNVAQGLCIGDDMAKEYESRYDRRFYPLMNCVPDGLFETEPGENYGNSVVLTYVGGLHLNRWKSLLDMATMLPVDCRMKVFAPPRDIRLFSAAFSAFEQVELGSLQQEEVDPELRRADILLHVESFDPEAAAYTRLSVSTKIPQYMAAGRPILGYGPSDLASIRVIERAHAGVVVSAQQPNDLADALQRLVADEPLRRQLGQGGRNYGRTHFSQTAATRQLTTVLGAAAGHHSPG